MIGVNVDTKLAVAAITKTLKQIPFATRDALNDVTKQSQDVVRRELPEHFTVRRKSFLEQSIKISHFAKGDELYTLLGVPPRARSGIDQALALQEKGGTRQSLSGKAQAVPIGARPSPSAITTPAKWPSKLKRSFIITTKGGATLVLQRKGRSKGTAQAGQHDPNLTVMYDLERTVKVPKRWNMVERITETVTKNWTAAFNRALAAAIRGAHR